MIEHFQINAHTDYAKAEGAVYKFCLYLKDFDNLRTGSLRKEIFFEILRDITNMTLQEINNLIDFAMGTSKIDEDSFSYQFFCVQLNEFY